jgi:uncharacterized membrane protein YkoI
MKRWYLALGLTFVLATVPAACGRGENEENEAGEMSEANEANEANEAAEAAAETPEAQAALLARAQIDKATATKTALASVQNGTVKSSELEEEDGKLIWSFDISVAGQEGITEVHVDALTGQIIKTEHESEESEAAEGKEPG